MALDIKKILVLVALIAVGVALYNYGVTEYCSLAYINTHLASMQNFIAQHYWYAVFLFIGTFFLVTTSSVPGASFFLIASGLFFGIIPGVIYSVIAATLGATVLFLASRYVLGSWVQRRYAQKLAWFNGEIQQYGHYYLLAVRSITIIPFSLITLLSGLTVIPLTTFMWATALGMLPSTFIFAFIGKQLCNLGCFDTFLCPPIIIALSVLVAFKVCVVIASYFLYRRRAKP